MLRHHVLLARLLCWRRPHGIQANLSVDIETGETAITFIGPCCQMYAIRIDACDSIARVLTIDLDAALIPLLQEMAIDIRLDRAGDMFERAIGATVATTTPTQATHSEG